MNWALVFPGGNKSSESALAGMAATMGRVSRANAEIFATAGI
jgi:hypothetical protein